MECADVSALFIRAVCGEQNPRVATNKFVPKQGASKLAHSHIGPT